jgi:hypothetical protein
MKTWRRQLIGLQSSVVFRHCGGGTNGRRSNRDAAALRFLAFHECRARSARKVAFTLMSRCDFHQFEYRERRAGRSKVSKAMLRWLAGRIRSTLAEM